MMQFLLIFAIVPGISPRPAVGPQTRVETEKTWITHLGRLVERGKGTVAVARGQDPFIGVPLGIVGRTLR